MSLHKETYYVIELFTHLFSFNLVFFILLITSYMSGTCPNKEPFTQWFHTSFSNGLQSLKFLSNVSVHTSWVWLHPQRVGINRVFSCYSTNSPWKQSQIDPGFSGLILICDNKFLTSKFSKPAPLWKDLHKFSHLTIFRSPWNNHIFPCVTSSLT